MLNIKKITGKVLGFDRRSYIAVVQLADRTLPQVKLATFADPKKLDVGEWTVAIGNPFVQENTVTVGVLSATGRTLPVPANEGANDGSDDDSNWVPTKKVKQAAKKKVASKTASTQEEKAGLRRIRERRSEQVNLLAKQLQEEANSEGADDHAAGNANSLKDAKQLLLQEDADVQSSDDADSDASLNNGDASDGEGGGFGSGGY